MTRKTSALSIPIPPVTVSIKVITPRGYRFRMWLMRVALSAAAAVAPESVTVETDIRATET